MKTSFSLFSVFGSLFMALCCCLLSCQSHDCRPSEAVKNTPAPTSKPTSVAERVLVYKYDGSLQCGQGNEVSLQEMEKSLAPIPIYRSFKKTDKQMRIQLCGSPTGQANVYEIDRNQLTAALKKGFKEWAFE